MPLEWHDRMTAMSSAIECMWGTQSLIHRPPLPYWPQVRLLASSGAPYSPMAVMTGLKLSGSGLPANCSSLGLGSNKSMWLGPPSMNRKMTRLALPK